MTADATVTANPAGETLTVALAAAVAALTAQPHRRLVVDLVAEARSRLHAVTTGPDALSVDNPVAAALHQLISIVADPDSSRERIRTVSIHTFRLVNAHTARITARSPQ